MQQLDYDPFVDWHSPAVSHADWLIQRLHKPHDITHVDTAFGPTGGALGVLSVQTVQIGYPMGVVRQVDSLG
jgi:ubiquinone biosynthesis protein COQ4